MTARDRGHVEEIINHLKRAENDYGIDLTSEMEWLRGLTKGEPLSEDLNTEMDNYLASVFSEDMDGGEPRFTTWFRALRKTAIHFANWQKQQFEKNRLKHCDSITNEQAELEQKFVDQHLDKYNRMPTYLDAIEYGMRLQKQQMMAKALDGKMVVGDEPQLVIPSLPTVTRHLDDGDIVKVIILKKE